MELKFEHVKGEKKGDVKLYALSTCGWCGKTKELLMQMGVDFNVIYVDLVDGDAKRYAIDKGRKFNKNCSFPTRVINNDKTIVGRKEAEMKEAVG